MEELLSMNKHLDWLDDLVVGPQTLQEPMDECRQLIILLSSLPVQYELISSIMENLKDVTLVEVKKMLLK